MIKLITVDLDGTLFDSNSKISRENKEAIKYCIKNGIKVVLSTGKSIKCSYGVINELGLTDLQIVAGGTTVITPDLRPILTIKTPRKSVLDSIKLARKNNVGLGLDTTYGKLYYDKYYPELAHIFNSGEIIEKIDDTSAEHIVESTLLLTF